MLLIGEDGKIDPHRRVREGIYYLDTRVIGRLDVNIPGEPKLFYTDAENDTIVFHYLTRISETSEDTDLVYHVKYKMFSDGVEVSVKFENFSNAEAKITLNNVIDYDFSDIFKIRWKVGHYAVRSSDARDYEHLTRKEKNCITYDTPHIRISIKTSGEFPKRFVIPPRETRRFSKKFSIKSDFKTDGFARKVFGDVKHAKYSLPTLPTIKSSGEKLSKLLMRSIEDISMLCMDTAYGPFPAAGVPWFSAIFGRDSLIFAIEAMEYFPDISRTILEILSITQSTISDDFRDAEVGKIIHEMRVGELALSKRIPFDAYYGSIDSTPLYLITLGQYWKYSKDDEFINQHLKNIEAAANWIDSRIYVRGYLAYKTRSKMGLKNQGWKDSPNSVLFANGDKPSPPIALSEVQGYVYAAYLALADLYKLIGDKQKNALYTNKAKSLKIAFNREFWMEDEQFYAMAMDGNGRQVDAISSNPGQCLFTGIVDDDKVRFVIQRLLSRDMFSGWGIRTLSAKMSAYNPYSYHNGSIWPHDNALIMLGMLKYGFHTEAKRLANALLGAAAQLNWRLPELFSGIERRRDDKVIPYPTSCSPQLWSAGSAFVIFKTLKEGGV